jgi:hypothetical protein
MAQKVSITLIDDIDGSEASETVTFGIDGATYEIDLNESNAAALREAVAGYVGHARKVTSGRRPAGRRSAAVERDTKAIREWARNQGHQISARGRVPAHIISAYEAAH